MNEAQAIVPAPAGECPSLAPRPEGSKQMTTDVGRVPTGTGLSSPIEPASGLAPSGFDASRECRTCAGTGWVCENHRDRPWYGLVDAPEACGCGAGAPCGSCNLHMASAGYVEPYRQLALKIAASAPEEKPDGPYDTTWGGYSSDNYGDVIADAEALCSWGYAEMARAVLRDSDGSREANETGTGSTEGNSAGRASGIAPTLSPESSS